ncbi:MAG: hypothetical protein M0D57_02325 [Sphingobacteriales bacterium JAD_PAG50586_3]|nr:MAG: hypothetical protein M0D57_02325 [Sphingobacteriales bacterium JAD_PAG50586_3]
MKLNILIILLLIVKINSAQPMPDSLGHGLNMQVSCIYSDTANDIMIVAGSFTTADSRIAVGFAKYNGTVWDTTMCGFTQDCNSTSPFWGQFTNVITPYNGQLYFGGVFDWAGGIHTGGIAMLDGDTLKAVGGIVMETSHNL